MELRKTFRFEASHLLPKHPGKCSRLHGHSWVLHVHVKGSINKDTGFVQDYADISSIVKPLVESLDHRHLGTHWSELERIPPEYMVNALPKNFYPTSENLVMWIAGQLDKLDLYRITGPNEEPRVFSAAPGDVIPFGEDEEVTLLSYWSMIQLEETCTSLATLTREEYNGGIQLHGR